MLFGVASVHCGLARFERHAAISTAAAAANAAAVNAAATNAVNAAAVNATAVNAAVTTETGAVSHRWSSAATPAPSAALEHPLGFDISKSPCSLVASLLSGSPEAAGLSAALAAMAVLIALVAALISLAAPTVRGPPARPVAPLSGRARLARFCISRR
jgi:hypothetical protein